MDTDQFVRVFIYARRRNLKSFEILQKIESYEYWTPLKKILAFPVTEVNNKLALWESPFQIFEFVSIENFSFQDVYRLDLFFWWYYWINFWISMGSRQSIDSFECRFSADEC